MIDVGKVDPSCVDAIFPQYDTMWYWGYCQYAHNVAGFHCFPILCSVQLFFAFIALLNVFPVSFLLYIEVRIQQQIQWSKPVKFISLVLIIISQLIVFVHYFLIVKQYKLLITLQQFTIGMVFLSLCYLFCKNSSKILPGRKRWLTIIKVIGVISFAGNVVVLIF